MNRLIYATVLPFFLLLFSAETLCSQNSVLAQKITDLQQSGIPFATTDHLFTTLAPLKNPKTDLERNAQYLELNKSALADIMSARADAITLSIPYNNQVLILDLYQAQVFAEGYSVKTQNGQVTDYVPGAYYRGIIRGIPNSLVAISFFDTEVMGVIAHPQWGNLNLGKMDWPGNETRYALFSDQNLPMPFSDCVVLRGDQPDHPHTAAGTPEVSGCVRIYMESDYALYQQNMNSIANTANYVTNFFNVVASLYTNETITIAISQIFVWTTQDPYSYASSSAALGSFMNYRPDGSFDGDLAHLVSLAGTSLGGVAYLDVLCSNSFNYGFSGINATYQNLPFYSWTVNVVAHELGHNFGSEHTHACVWNGNNTAIDGCGPTYGAAQGIGYEGSCSGAPIPIASVGGTIMSYCHLGAAGVNFANGFGPQPGAKIRTNTTNALNAACITTNCPTSTCTTPSNIAISSITNNSASITWTGSGTTYTLQYRVTGTAVWTTITGISTIPYTLSGLSPFVTYEIQIQAICSGTPSRYSTIVAFKTIASACAEPSGLSASPLSSTQASLNWTENGTATTWDIQHGAAGFSLGSGTIVGVTAHPYTLSGLTAGTAYSFYVRATCGGGNNSTWVGPFTFTMPFGNDLSSGAINLTLGTACPGLSNAANFYSNVGSGISAGEFSPTTTNGGYWDTGISNTVWFKFTAPASGSVKITTDLSPLGTLIDPEIALYNTATPTTINHHLVSNEDGGVLGVGYATYAYYSGLTSGSVYYIQVDGWNTSVGTFCIEVSEAFALNAPSCVSYSQTNVNGAAAPTKWFNIYTKPNGADIGLPVAAVKSSVDLGTVTVDEIKNPSVPVASNGVKYMQRYYNFNSTLNAAASKQVRLFYATAEFTAFLGAGSATIDDLNIYHYDGVNENCTPNDNGPGGTVITTVSATNIGSSGYFYLEYASSFSEMGAILGTTLLPVELTAFDGIIDHNYNTLHWNTAAEKDIDHFAVERSADGLGHWETVCEAGQGLPNNKGERNYNCQDINPLTNSFYRLAIYNRDGSIEYSNIVALERAMADGIRSVAPNPTQEVLYVEYNATQEQSIVFNMIGADGRIVLRQSIDMNKGLNVLPFDVSVLPAGLYYIAANVGKGMPFVKK